MTSGARPMDASIDLGGGGNDSWAQSSWRLGSELMTPGLRSHDSWAQISDSWAQFSGEQTLDSFSWEIVADSYSNLLE